MQVSPIPGVNFGIIRLMAGFGTGGEVEAPSQAASSMTRLKGEVRVCSGISPRSQLIN